MIDVLLWEITLRVSNVLPFRVCCQQCLSQDQYLSCHTTAYLKMVYEEESCKVGWMRPKENLRGKEKG